MLTATGMAKSSFHTIFFLLQMMSRLVSMYLTNVLPILLDYSFSKMEDVPFQNGRKVTHQSTYVKASLFVQSDVILQIRYCGAYID